MMKIIVNPTDPRCCGREVDPLILRETFKGAYRFDRLRKLVAAAPQDAALEVTHRSTRSLSRQANFR